MYVEHWQFLKDPSGSEVLVPWENNVITVGAVMALIIYEKRVLSSMRKDLNYMRHRSVAKW